MGIPGVRSAVVEEVGPESSFFGKSEPLLYYIRVFEDNVSQPLIALVASMLSPSSFLKEMFGHSQSLSSVISKVRAIVEGFGALRSGEFVQDLVGLGGVLFGKVSDIFAVGGGAGSPVAGGAA